jgi:dCTP deaminase
MPFMAVLSDHEIWSLLASGRLRIDPAPPVDAVQTSSVDLRLGRRFTRLKALPEAVRASVDTRRSTSVMEAIASLGREEEVTGDNFFLISPGEFALAWTLEEITLPNFLCARVEGRSTLARLGLSIHQTAPTVHASFSNPLQLELRNSGPYPLELFPEHPVCQLIIETMTSPATSALTTIHTKQA